MNENPFNFELGDKVYYIYHGEIIYGLINFRQCSDELHKSKSKTRKIGYTFQEIKNGFENGRGFGCVKEGELFRSKEQAAMQILEAAGLDIGLISIKEKEND